MRKICLIPVCEELSIYLSIYIYIYIYIYDPVDVTCFFLHFLSFSGLQFKAFSSIIGGLQICATMLNALSKSCRLIPCIDASSS